MNVRDIEILSSYLDGRLSAAEAARLEARLSSDASLKSTLEELRATRTLLRRLPQRRAPRSFRLTPRMAGIKPPEPRAYPIFRLATALAAFLFVASVALNAFTPFAATRLAAAPAPAQAPAYGIGGGGGGGGGGGAEPPAATEAAPLAPFAALAPTATPEGTLSSEAATEVPQAQDTARAQANQATEQASKAAPLQQFQGAHAAPASPQPVPLGWVVALGAIMLICGLAAWLMRSGNDRRVRGRWNQK